MNAHQRRAVLRLLTIFVAGAILDSSQALAARPFLTETAVFHEKDDGYFIHRIPALWTTDKGTLLAFCEARIGSVSDAAATDVVLRRSLDNGKTWTAAQVVAHFPNYTVGNPTPVQDAKTGVVWLLLTVNPADVTEKEIEAGSPKGTRTVWITQSSDDGATWSAAQEITATTKKPDWTWYATGPGNGIQLQTGRLVIPCDYKVIGTHAYYAHVIYSDDDGKTWQLGGSAGPETNESAVAELADGSLILNMRSYAHQNRRAVAYSHDGGITWSAVQLDSALVEPVCEASMVRYQVEGKDALIFANPADTVRDRMTVRVSYDGGKTWPASRLVFADFAEYSSLAVLKDGTIGLLYTRGPGKPSAEHGWYPPNNPEIVFARFNLEWITQGKDHLNARPKH